MSHGKRQSLSEERQEEQKAQAGEGEAGRQVVVDQSTAASAATPLPHDGAVKNPEEPRRTQLSPG
jgi:hypothetical protein